jgi:ABC-type transporter Mla subunit MlaD
MKNEENMARFKPVLTLSLLSLLVLTACAEASKTVSDTADKAKDATEQAANTAADTAQKAKDATEQAANTAADTVQKAKDATEQAANTATDTAQKTTDAAKETVSKATDAIGGIADVVAVKDRVAELKTGATETLDAVKQGDFSAAKDKFGALQQSWYQFGGSLKALPGGGYEQIDAGLKAVKSAMNQDTPDQEQLSGKLEGIVDLLKKVPLG